MHCLQVLFMPTLVMSARVCPEGVEATLYACLMSLLNAASGVSDALGGLLTHLFGVTAHNFDHLFALVLLTNCLLVLPLPLLAWVPAAVDRDSGEGCDGRGPGDGVGDVGEDVSADEPQDGAREERQRLLAADNKAAAKAEQRIGLPTEHAGRIELAAIKSHGVT